MKIKKSYIIGAAIVVLLAVVIIMGVTKPDSHAGHNHDDPHAGHNHTTAATQPDGPSGADLTPDKAYMLRDNKDGSYTALVKGRNGDQIASDRFLSKPTFTEVNQDVLEISDRSFKNTSAHWAKFYDIQNNRVSQKYQFVLATLDSHVAYVDHRSGQFHVFVSDVFSAETYFKGYELKGAAVTQSGSPEISYTINASTLTVTYSTEKGTDTIEIKMFAK